MKGEARSEARNDECDADVIGEQGTSPLRGRRAAPVDPERGDAESAEDDQGEDHTRILGLRMTSLERGEIPEGAQQCYPSFG